MNYLSKVYADICIVLEAKEGVEEEEDKKHFEEMKDKIKDFVNKIHNNITPSTEDKNYMMLMCSSINEIMTKQNMGNIDEDHLAAIKKLSRAFGKF